MKKLIPFLSLIVLASCGEKGSSEKAGSVNILENLTYAVDTVVVDPGEEIINLSMGLYLSDVSKDKKWLYHFDSDNTLINAVDLDKLRLDHQINFEKEGPDGVGSFVYSLQALPGEVFMISPFRTSGIFDSQGKKLENTTLKPGDYSGIEEEDEVELSYMLRSSENRKFLFSLPGDFMVSGRNLLKFDKANKTAESIDIPQLDLTEKFTLINRQGEFAEISMEDYFLEEFDGKLYVASSVTSDFYTYDLSEDSLSFYSLPLQIVPKAKTELPKNEVNSPEEYREQRDLIRSQITYSNLLWDDSKDLFFRIGRTVTPSSVPDGKPNIEVYLVAFDKEMKLAGETKLEGIETNIEKPFFKDGKLWTYVNVDDELGFAVFTFDF